MPLAALGRLQLLAGQVREAAETVRLARSALQRDGTLLTPLWVMLADGEIALAQGDFERAAMIAAELQGYLSEFQTRTGTADALLLAGRAELRRGNLDRAGEHLAAARAEVLGRGARNLLWPILAELARIEEQVGEAASATGLRAEAAAIVADIAASVAEPRWRSWLLAPGIRVS
jgi:ATP/maltotriose-dependent transcriptional regulator MalT